MLRLSSRIPSVIWCPRRVIDFGRTPSLAAWVSNRPDQIGARLFLQVVGHPPPQMRRLTVDMQLPFVIILNDTGQPAAGAGMDDPVRHVADADYAAIGDFRHLRHPRDPGGNPVAVLIEKFIDFPPRCAWRHTHSQFAAAGGDAQGQAPAARIFTHGDRQNRDHLLPSMPSAAWPVSGPGAVFSEVTGSCVTIADSNRAAHRGQASPKLSLAERTMLSNNSVSAVTALMPSDHLKMSPSMNGSVSDTNAPAPASVANPITADAMPAISLCGSRIRLALLEITTRKLVLKKNISNVNVQAVRPPCQVIIVMLSETADSIVAAARMIVTMPKRDNRNRLKGLADNDADTGKCEQAGKSKPGSAERVLIDRGGVGDE